MAHIQQLTFISLVKEHFIPNPTGISVLEIGSYDYNGSIRPLFQGANYIGVDLCEGPGVDMVCFGHEVDLADSSFDLTISCECFEHDPHWIDTIKNMYRITKPGGLVVTTCATLGRIEHGTRRSSADFSPGTQFVGLDYYKNLERSDFEAALNLPSMFSSYLFFTIPTSFDLYFIGWKNGDSQFRGDAQKFSRGVNDIKRIRRFRFKLFDLPISMARHLLREDKFQDFACRYYQLIAPIHKFFKSLGRVGRS